MAFARLSCIPLLAVITSLTVLSQAHSETWEERRIRRCGYYRELVRVAFENVDPAGMRPEFIAGHEAFVGDGCFAGKAVCPKTTAEFAFADILTMMTVSANMGSTFTPFRCPVEAASSDGAVSQHDK